LGILKSEIYCSEEAKEIENEYTGGKKAFNPGL
jgi:hypothetical protein